MRLKYITVNLDFSFVIPLFGIKMKILIFLILTALIALSMGHGDEEDTPNTIEYSSAEFVQEVPKTNHFVMFYAPW